MITLSYNLICLMLNIFEITNHLFKLFFQEIALLFFK